MAVDHDWHPQVHLDLRCVAL